MKKIISTVLIMLFVNAQATIPTADLKSLDAAFDNLNFNMEVVWDQTDMKAYGMYVSSFQKEIETLNVSKDDLIAFAKTKISDPKISADLDGLFGQVSTMTSSDARNFVANYVGKNYSEGLSWSGRSSGGGGVLVLLLLLSALGGISSPSSSSCYDEYVCYDYWNVFGGYWYTDCYWDTVCY